MAHWEFLFLPKKISITEETFFGIQHVFLDGFGIQKEWSIAGIKHAMERSTLLSLLKSEENDIQGYAFYTIPDVPLLGSFVLWEDAICLKKNQQGQKLASRTLFGQICDLFPERNFGWIGGRTQNPVVLARYAQFGNLFPFVQTYHSDTGKLVLRYLMENVAEVRESIASLNQMNGICRNIYPEGRLGQSQPWLKQTKQFKERLQTWQFDPDAGDAIVAIAQISQLIRNEPGKEKNNG